VSSGPAIARPPSGPADPVRRLPRAATTGARREVSLVAAPTGEWTEGCVVRGRARDVRRAADGTPEVVDQAAIEIRTDPGWTVLDAAVAGHPDVAAALRGRRARGGFRTGLAELEAVGLDPASTPAALLDDLSSVRLISGYAMLMEAESTSGSGAPLLNICSGWRADGTAARRAMDGGPLLGSVTRAPVFADLFDAPEDFLDEEPLTPRTMRRRRVLEIARDTGESWSVTAYLRDSHVDRAGDEHGLHEYVVTAVAEGSDLVLRSVVAEPRTLPFGDCPLASPNVDRLVGMAAGEAGRGVLDRLPGVAGCTHLNDVLRTFRFLPQLAALTSQAERGENES
jgi:hypothetical protein